MKRKIVTDVAWNVSALVLFNGILQCIVYPWMNKYMGTDKFGEFLYVIAVISVFAPAIGLANNNTRIVTSKDQRTYNGDYLISIVSQMIISSIACVIILFPLCSSRMEMVLIIFVLIAMSFRYYSDVEFRLELNY